MPTHEERILALEQAQIKFGESISDLNHYVTMMTGILSRQEWDIREIKSTLRSIDSRLGSFDSRLGSFDDRLGSFERHVNSRFETLEQSMNTRFEGQDKKFDQILLLLNTLIPTKPE